LLIQQVFKHSQMAELAMAAHCVISYLHIPCSTNLTYGLPTDLNTGEGVPMSHSDIYFIPRVWPTSLTVVNCKLAECTPGAHSLVHNKLLWMVPPHPLAD
jgi:hypothetical protein